ncbi:MAG: elongation factor P [bacterium]
MATQYSAGDLRKGLKVEFEKKPYVVTEFTFVKPGKGASIYTCRLKCMLDGTTMQRAFRANDVFGVPDLEEKTMRYSYNEGDDFIFMDTNFEQITIPAKVLGDSRYFLFEDCEVQVLFFNNNPVEVTLPTFVEKVVIETQPGARGNTAAGNVTKPAKIAGGYELPVPLFVNEGDTIKIDTRTGLYSDRVLRR